MVNTIFVKGMRWFVLLITLSFWFIPHFYKLQLTLVLLLGVALLILYRIRRNAFQWTYKCWETTSNLFVPFLFVTLALVFRLSGDWYIYSYHQFWLPWILVFVFVVFLFFDKAKLMEKDTTSVISMVITVVLLSGYSFGVVLGLNYLLDTSEETIVETPILKKSLTNSRFQLHQMEVEGWDQTYEPATLIVDHTTYTMKEPGDSLYLVFYKGGMGIPYYFILY